MPIGNISIPIRSAAAQHTAGGFSLTTIRMWVEISFATQKGPPLRRQCLLDTGAPLSIVPFAVHHSCSLAWQPIPGPWPPGLTTWSGVRCEIGAIDVWVRQQGVPHLIGPLKFIAKFALATPANMPPVVPILLGLNFLADHFAQAEFQCHSVPHAGQVSLP